MLFNFFDENKNSRHHHFRKQKCFSSGLIEISQQVGVLMINKLSKR